jgi:flagellar assembly protein FliH
MPDQWPKRQIRTGTRIFQPDDDRPAGAVPWRQIGAVEASAGAAPTPAAAAADADTAWRSRVAELERQCQEKVRQARAAGAAEGEAAGRSRAAAEVQPVLEKFSQTIAEISGMRNRLRREAEADTIQLALAIARRVLRRELAVDPEALHGLVLGALEKLESREISRVRVHPAQAASIATCLRKTAGGDTVEVIADGRCDPGAAIFETPRGNLDASIDTQLQEIERGLADCLGRRS